MAWFGAPPRPGSYREQIRTRFPGIQASLTRGAPPYTSPTMPGVGVGGYTRPGTIQGYPQGAGTIWSGGTGNLVNPGIRPGGPSGYAPAPITPGNLVNPSIRPGGPAGSQSAPMQARNLVNPGIRPGGPSGHAPAAPIAPLQPKPAGTQSFPRGITFGTPRRR